MKEFKIKFKAGNSNITEMTIMADKIEQVIPRVQEYFNVTEVKAIVQVKPVTEKQNNEKEVKKGA